jgi:hypothetical protein
MAEDMGLKLLQRGPLEWQKFGVLIDIWEIQKIW